MSHTPGPWRMDSNGRDVRSGGVGGLFIARTYAIPVEDNPDDSYRIEQEANARLVAAAPDLLAALKAIEAYWSAENFSRDEHLWASMDDAIRKAEPR